MCVCVGGGGGGGRLLYPTLPNPQPIPVIGQQKLQYFILVSSARNRDADTNGKVVL
jgi:hypothetical protein